MKLKEIPHYTVVHTPTEEEAKELLAILHENGWKWIEDYGEEDDITYWDRYEHKTCYNLKPGKIIDTEEYYFYASEGYTILPFSAFERLYCEQEKPQPKFKVGDKVRIIQDGTVNPDDVDIVDEIESITQYIRLKNTDSNWFETCLEPYTEPETKEDAKDTKDDTMETKDETKELNLLEILKSCDNERFYCIMWGDTNLMRFYDNAIRIAACADHDTYIVIDAQGKCDDDGVCMLYPSRALYEQYPLDPYTAWMKWQEEQADLLCDFSIDSTNKGWAYRAIFRTPADFDKCIEEITEIIEKYSK